MTATDLVAYARDIGARELAPTAELVDQSSGVTRQRMDLLRPCNGISAPKRLGGSGVDQADAFAIHESVGAACGTTAFVWTQHHGAVRHLLLAGGPLAEHWVPRLASGGLLSGVGVAFLRRGGPPAVTARAEGTQWIIDGTVPWLTGWGVSDVHVLCARIDDDRREPRARDVLVFVLHRLQDDALRPSPPIALAAFNASRTVSLRLDHHVVDAPDAGVLPADDWAQADIASTLQPNPYVFGIARTAGRLLRETGRADREASVFSQELAALRAEAAELADVSFPAPEPVLRAKAELRARLIDHAIRCALALVAATGGQAMERTNPPQRLLREAAFYLIQAQTAPVREASLRLLSD